MSLIWILVVCFFSVVTVPAEDSARQAKAEMAAKKAAAAKAAAIAKAKAKAVQKAQEIAAEKRINADKLLEIANADKAKLTEALGRNANQKTLEKLTRSAHKSAEAARIAQEESEKAAGDIQAAMVAARQAEVRETEAFEALDSPSAVPSVAPKVAVPSSTPASAPTPAPVLNNHEKEFKPDESKSQEDIERQKRLAQIEAAVEEARQRRTQNNPAVAVPPATSPAAPVVSTPAPVTPAAASPAATAPAPEITADLAQTPPATLTPELEQKARELLQKTPSPGPQIAPPAANKALAPATIQSSSTPPTTVLPVQTPQSGATTPAAAIPLASTPGARTLSPEMENKARELLRQTTASVEAAAPPVAPSPIAVPAAPAPTTEPKAVTAIPAPSTTLSPEMEKRTRELLNQAEQAGARNSSTLSPEMQSKARQLLNQGAAPTPAAPPSTTLPGPQSSISNPPATAVAPATSPSALGSVPVPDPTVTPAVEKRLRELTSSYSKPAPVVVAVPVAAPVGAPSLAQSNPVPPPAVVTAPPASLTTPASAETKYAANGLTPEQEAKARDLLRQLKGESKAPAAAPVQTTGERAPVPPVSAPAVAAPAAPPLAVPENLPSPANPPAAVAPSATLATPGSNPAMTPEQELKAHQLLEQKASEVAPRPSGPTAIQSRNEALKNAEAEARALLESRSKQQQKSTTPQPVPVLEQKAKSKGNEPQTAVEAIPLPISGSKQQRLAQLLEAYKRDQMTAVQYHQERAKILAEP